MAEVQGQVEAIFFEKGLGETVMLAIKVDKHTMKTTWKSAKNNPMKDRRRTQATVKPRIICLSLTQHKRKGAGDLEVMLHMLKPPSSKEDSKKDKEKDKDKDKDKDNVKSQHRATAVPAWQMGKTFKLEALSRIEGVAGDKDQRQFVLVFDVSGRHSTSVFTLSSTSRAERNALLSKILQLAHEYCSHEPALAGISVTPEDEAASTHSLSVAGSQAANGAPQDPSTQPSEEDSGTTTATQGAQPATEAPAADAKPKVVLSPEEENALALLMDSYVMSIEDAEALSNKLARELSALVAANVHAILGSEEMVEKVTKKLDTASAELQDLTESLAIFNVKLTHMRSDIETIEARNNKLEVQARNNRTLLKVLGELLEKLTLDDELLDRLEQPDFNERRLSATANAALELWRMLEAINGDGIDEELRHMRAVKERKMFMEQLRSSFVSQAATHMGRTIMNIISESLNAHKEPPVPGLNRYANNRQDNSELQRRLNLYSPVIGAIEKLDIDALPKLRDLYSSSMNALLRRKIRDYTMDMRASLKHEKVEKRSAADLVSKRAGSFTGFSVHSRAREGGSAAGSSDGGSATGEARIQECFRKMLRLFIPMLETEWQFCVEYLRYNPPAAKGAGGGTRRGPRRGESGSRGSSRRSSSDSFGLLEETVLEGSVRRVPMDEATTLKHQQPLLEGTQEDFLAVVDWAVKAERLLSISMIGDVDLVRRTVCGGNLSPFVAGLLNEVHTRLQLHFNKFLEEATSAIDKAESHGHVAKKGGSVAPFVTKFVPLAVRMEELLDDRPRDVVDTAYYKLVGAIFRSVDRLSNEQTKYADLFLLENYAAFMHGTGGLARKSPTLAKLQARAGEAYEAACARYIDGIIFKYLGVVLGFVAQVDEMLKGITPEEVSFQVGFSRADVRKLLKSELSGTSKYLSKMSKKIIKHVGSDSVLQPQLWRKCQERLLDKFRHMEKVMADCYPGEVVSPSTAEVKEMLKGV
eukprot:jgi/Mesvir1/29296/Mv01559-RA.1